MKWQPIETAPKDGAEIVGYDSATKTIHAAHFSHRGWYDPDMHYYSETPAFIPTHWVPLPELPTE